MTSSRISRPRISRRRFLAATGGVAAAGALAAAGCSGGSNDSPSPTPGEAPDLPTRAAGGSATRRPEGIVRGGTIRYAGLVMGDGQYDPHRTQAGPFYGQQSMNMSRLMAFQDQGEGSLVADLAETLPEQPEPSVYIFKLRPDARWHDGPPLEGRPVTADDVKASIDRQSAGDASFVRRARWQQVESVEVQDPQTVLVRLKQPYAPMPGVFASVNSFIVPQEYATGSYTFSASDQPGSGPFRWVEWSEGRLGSVARNPNWYGGNERPYLDGVSVTQPRDTAEVEAGLRTKQFDQAFVGRTVADQLRKNIPQLQEQTFGHSRFFGMRFFTAIAPYDDLRLRAALSFALDRREMLEKFFQGSGEHNPWVSWPVSRWTLPQSELARTAGYRTTSAGREKDLTEARQLVAAYLSEKELPGKLPLYVPEDTERSLGMGALMRDQVKRNVNLNVEVFPVSITEIIQGLIDNTIPWTAGPDDGWVDLDDWVYPYFHSAGPKNSFPLRDAEMDSMIEAQRTELDEVKRRDIGYNIQRRVHAFHAGENLVSERVVSMAWPYVKNFPLDTTDGYQHRFADCWLDSTDPNFRGR